MFSVLPKAGLATGTAINAQASIVFDTNAALATNVDSNTMDNDAPTSALKALPKTQAKAAIKLKLTGDDAASGVKDYTIHVQADGGAFQPLVRNAAGPTTVFNGVTGHKYAFISQARDAAGNLEPMRTKKQTKIKIVGPDLVGTWGGDLRTKVNAKGLVKIKGTFTLRNQSPDQPTTAGGTVRFYVSASGKFDDTATAVGQDAEFGILPGGGTALINLPGAKLASGQSASGLFLLAVIDPDGAVTEADKTNNEAIAGPLP